MITRRHTGACLDDAAPTPLFSTGATMCKNKTCKHLPRLERLLERLKHAGEPLPDSGWTPRRPNLNRIAELANIPYQHLRTTPQLRARLERAANELGAGPNPNPKRSNVLRRNVTYAELIEAARDSNTYPDPRYLNALQRFMNHHRRVPEDFVGAELRNGTTGIEAFIAKSGIQSSRVDRSALNYWKKWWARTSSLEHLPNNFNEALALLVEAANISIAELARATNINRKLLWEYVNTTKRPLKSPQHVMSLEKHFHLAPRTLARMLPNHTPPSTQATRNLLTNDDVFVPDVVRQALPSDFALLPPKQQAAVVRDIMARLERQPPPTPYAKLSAARKSVPYRFKYRRWPAHLQAEFNALVASVGEPNNEHKPTPGVFKTARQRHRDEPDPDAFQGHKPVNGQPRRWSENSQTYYLQALESFFGYLTLREGQAIMPPFERPAGQQPHLAPRFGLAPEHLTLGLLAVDELLMEFLAFRYFERGVGYNRETLHLMGCLRSLLIPAHGWVRYQPDIARRALATYTHLGFPTHDEEGDAVTFADLCDSTVESLTLANANILEETPNAVTDLVARDVFAPAKPILNQTSPKAVLTDMLHCVRRELTHDTHLDNAIYWRDYIYARLLVETALRGEHFPGLRWGHHPRHAHLREEHRDGKTRLLLFIPRHEFKNARYLVDRGSLEKELPQDLANDIRHYIDNVRPRLARNNSSTHVFLTSKGTPLKDKSLRKRFVRITGRYLTVYSPVGLQIDGVKPFGPHLVRHILAVDLYLKTGSYQAVADLLLNTETVARRAYAVLDLSQRHALANQRGATPN